jgi:uncharacterized membrane protein
VGDVVATLALVGLCAGVVSAGATGPLRAVLGGVLVLLLPGYALTTLVFPAASGAREAGRDRPVLSAADPGRASLSFVERVAVGIGLSVALVPLYGYLLGASGREFLTGPVVAVTAGAAAAFLALGGVRRLRVDDDRRYVVPLGGVVRAAGAVRAQSGTKRALNVALAGAVVLATVVVTFALVSPVDGTEYTQVSVLTENENGTLVAAGYPENITVGESAELVLLVENYERETASYTVVVQLQRVGPNGTVTEWRELDRFSNTVEPGGEWRKPHRLSPTMTGRNLRVAYLLYRGDAPASPSIESSYRHLTLWTDVTRGGFADA